jgi:hypothetical protein
VDVVTTAQNSLLRKLMRDNRSNAALKIMASRSGQVSEVEDVLNAMLEVDAGARRYDVVRLLKKLGGADFGSFRAGRRGMPSRFEWNSHLKGYIDEIEVAKEKPASPATQETVRDDSSLSTSVAPQCIRHTYWLRGDCAVQVELPINLTEREAGRFADFIRSLPLT